MKLATYRRGDADYVGIVNFEYGRIAPVRDLGLAFADMNELICGATSKDLDTLRSVSRERFTVDLSEVLLLSPIPRPKQDVICLGLNYTEHAQEAAAFSQEAFVKKDKRNAVYFSKRVNEAPGPDGVISAYEGLVDSLDYEAELAVVIGRDARNVRLEDAPDYIFGYTVLNDVSARNLQTAHTQWYFGKSLDGFTPMGPVITTADEIAFPPALGIRSRVNGQLRQESVTDMLITGIDEMICELSRGMTLKAGTIIATGTPKGVGMGFDPPIWLRSGDVVECEIDGIGILRNRVE